MALSAFVAELASALLDTTLDVLPIALFLLFFYRVVLKQRLANRGAVLAGLGFVIVGLALLLLGLDKALFPVGRLMVEQLVGASAPHAGTGQAYPWTAYYPVYAFAFCLAFGAAIAEPALLAIALRVNEISGGAVPALGLRIAAAVGVASGVSLGCIRIATGDPLHWWIGAGYAVIALQTLLAPRTMVAVAYDSGGVSTTAVTVPVITALGLGLAEQLPGRNPLLDGFGLISFACLGPVIAVLGYAQLSSWLDRRQSRRMTADDADGARPDKEE